jgi:UDP:flavonoid glycosyltransferase YjiC (YdhE family)
MIRTRYNYLIASPEKKTGRQFTRSNNPAGLYRSPIKYQAKVIMKITIFAAGSQGDIQPCVVLAKGLQQAGYQVSLAAPADFAGFIAKHNLNFHPLRGDVQQIMASDTGRKFMEKGGHNPIKSISTIRTLIAPVIQEMSDDAFAACADADGLVCLGVFSAFGHTIADALKIPIVNIEPTPLLPSRSFPAPSWPIQLNLGGLHNFLSGRAMLQVVWYWYKPFVNDFRKRLGLPAYSGTRFYHGLRDTPLIGAYSPGIIPQPPDWPDNVHVSGYLFLDSQAEWQPPAELSAFLNAGAPPVYIGFGSMSGQSPEKLADLAMRALEKSGQRGVLLTGWGGLKPEQLTSNVFVLNSAPHSWLFPRMAALVHHGGAGTTAEGLRAGVPSIIVPFILDQPFWGARVQSMGLGPAPLPQKKLTAERLAAAITTAVTDSGMRERARLTGEAIRAEDGVGSAVKLVQRYLGKPN